MPTPQRPLASPRLVPRHEQVVFPTTQLGDDLSGDGDYYYYDAYEDYNWEA
jgi:hypothetical protein